MNNEELTSVLESLLFASGNPVSVTQLSEIVGEEARDVRMALLELSRQYAEEGRGIEIVRFEDRFQMTSAGINGEYVRRMLDNRRNSSLSQAALEVLAVVAYQQPVTRAYIEQVRGVDCSAVVHTLVEKELIEEKGRLDAPGRPLLYGTTMHFLRVFDLSSLAELPDLPAAAPAEGESEPESEAQA